MAIAPDALKYFAQEMVKVGGTLSGIVGDAAHTYGYHRAFNEVSSGDYSRQLPLDQVSGTAANYASAVDWSLPESGMKTVTQRLINAAEHPEDNRLDALREFYGTTNGSDVVGRSHNGIGQAWSFVSSDDSHLWHIHLSFFRQKANDRTAIDKVLSVVQGITWEQYKAGGGTPPPATPPVTPPGGSVSLRVLPGVNMDSVSTKLKTYFERVLPADVLSKLYVTSANRGSSGVDYHEDTGSNGAIDVAGPMNDSGQRAMQAMARIVIKDADLLLELIHTTPFSDDNGFYVKNGSVIGGYGEPTNSQHLNHVHTATSESMADALLRRHPAGSTGTPPPVSPPPTGPPDPNKFPLPAGHYFGDINGPAQSHGGHSSAPASDRYWIKAIQVKLQEKGHAPAGAGWADGLYEAPTTEAVKKFQRASGLTPDGLVGPFTWTKLFQSTSPAPAKTYKVLPGDTLTRIAKKYGTTVAELARLNSIADPNRLVAGQVIKLPS